MPVSATESTEPAAEEAERTIPRLLSPDRVVLGRRDAARPDGGLVGEGVVCEVAVEVEFHAGFAQFVLQLIDGRDREELVRRESMALQRCTDLGCVDVLQRRAAVPDYGGVDFRSHAHGQQRQRTPHAKPG